MQAEELEREQRYHHLLSEALERERDERRSFLASACGDDPELLEELLEACSADEGIPEGFLEAPVLVHTPAWIEEENPYLASPKVPPTRVERTRSDPSTERATTALERLRATRGLALFLAMALAMLVLAGAGLLGAARLLAAAHTRIDFGAISGKIVASEDWPGARRGDHIVAVEGVRVESDPVRIRQAFLALEPGPVTLRLRRGDEEWDVTTEVAPAPLGVRTLLRTRVVTGTLLIAIGTLAFVLRPGSRVTWLFFFFCCALGGHLVAFMALLRRPPEAIVVEYLGLYLASSVGLHLFTVFPQQLFRKPRWAFGFYVPILPALTLIPLYSVAAAGPWIAGVVRFGSLFSAASGLAAVGLVLVHQRRALRADDTIVQARSRALLVAVVAGLALPAVLGVWMTWVLSSFPIVIFVAIMAYSMVRHNAMDVDRFTAAVLGYGTTTAVLVISFGLVVIGVPALFGTTGVFDSPILTAAVTATFFAVFHPLYRRIRKKVDRWFHRERVDEGTALRLVHQLADSVRTGELSKTFRVGLETAMTLQGERAELWTRTPDHSSIVRISSETGKADLGTATPIPTSSPLLEALAEGSGGVAGLADQVFPPAAQDELWDRDLALAAPILGNDQLHGFVGLARKSNGTRYTRAEREFLETVASQLGIAMERDWSLTEKVGPYRILRRLGTGGMAEVFLAEKHGPGGFERRVAVKRIHPHLSQDPACVAMFLDEARIAAQLHHPNIVQIYEIDHHEGCYYLAMELMDGPTLSELIGQAAERGERLALPVVSAMALAVLEALEYAHATSDHRGRPLGLVHRDVKPGNILLSRHGEIKLTDFGIARAEFRLYQTEPGLARGTPAYMAPEQQGGCDVGPSADLFSAGAVIYEAACGKKAFPLGPRRSRPEVLSSIVPGLPPALDELMLRALAERPEERFDSAGEMRSAWLSATAPMRPATREDVAAIVDSLSQDADSSPVEEPTRP